LPPDALPFDGLPPDALPFGALPFDALPFDALPFDGLPSGSLPSGRNQRYGAISRSAESGPQVPGEESSTGGRSASSGAEISHTRSIPSAGVKSDWSPSMASRSSRS